MTTYRVTATRDADWWSLVAFDVEGREVASQARRRLDLAEAAIREAIALVLDVDDDVFVVDVTPDLSHMGCPVEPSRLSSCGATWLSSPTEHVVRPRPQSPSYDRLV